MIIRVNLGQHTHFCPIHTVGHTDSFTQVFLDLFNVGSIDLVSDLSKRNPTGIFAVWLCTKYVYLCFLFNLGSKKCRDREHGFLCSWKVMKLD